VIIDADRVDRRPFLLAARNLGQVAVRRCTRSREIDGLTRLSAAHQPAVRLAVSARRAQYQNEQQRARERDRFSLLRARKNGPLRARRVSSEEIDRGYYARERTADMRIHGRRVTVK